MASMKDRLTRIEARLDAPVDQRAINEAAEQFDKMFNRLLDGLKPEDAAITLDERLASMSVVEHVVWCVGFVPDFRVDAEIIEQFMVMHRDARGRHPATQA